MRRCLFLAAIAGVAILILGGTCAYRRNARVQLVYSERYDSQSHAVGGPVWSADGSRIFFVRSRKIDATFVGAGNLCQSNADGSAVVQLLSDSVLSISPCGNGRTLALLTGAREAGIIAVYDLVSGSVTRVPTTHTDIAEVKFSRLDSEKLFYCSVHAGIVSVRVDGSGESLASAGRGRYFDLTSTDSLVLGDTSLETEPAVHPSGRYVAFVAWKSWPDIMLLDRQTGDTASLDARPYRQGYIEGLSWSPDGNSILFGSTELWGNGCDAYPAPSEIWRLDSAFN